MPFLCLTFKACLRIITSKDAPAGMTGKGKGQTRQRAQLSCDTCRRNRRKCDRTCPCAECRFRGKVCSFDRASATGIARKSRRLSSNKDNDTNLDLMQSDSVTNEENNTASVQHVPTPIALTNIWSSPQDSDSSHYLTTPSSIIPSDNHTGSVLMQLEALVCSPNTLHHIIATWRQEDDWYHEIVLDSPFMTAVMQHQSTPLSLLRQYAGIIYAITAIVAQSHPSELEAILIRLSTTSTQVDFTSAHDIGTGAEHEAKAWLNQATIESDASTWQAEVFQTSFLLMKLCKFLGRWEMYRQTLSLDLGRLQRANYHRLSGIMRDKSSTHQEISTRHRIFWHYFTLERLSSTFDGIPYTMQARNADMWLVEEAGAVHIHRLCSDKQDRKEPQFDNLPCYVPAALSLTLSLCGQLMARLGAQAGRFQDQIATLSAASTLSPLERFQRGNEIAAFIDEDLVDLQKRLGSVTLPSQHSLLIAIGIARIRRDVSILLCDNLQLNADDALNWDMSARHFHRRRLDLARALIQCAVDHSGRVMLSLLGEPFFTNFICDSVMELGNAVQKDCNLQYTDTALDDIKSAMTGRNLLVVISKQCELAENHKMALKTCQLLASVVSQVFTISDVTLRLSKVISDPTRMVAVDEFSILKESFKVQNINTYQDGGKAEEWLDWIASYPALERIFELPQSDFNPIQNNSDNMTRYLSQATDQHFELFT